MQWRRVWPWLALTLFAVTIAGDALLVHPWMTGKRTGMPAVVTLPRGATLRDASAMLAGAHLVPSAARFRLAARLFGSGRGLQAGTYRLTPGRPWREYLDSLQSGRVLALRVTIPEGLPSVLVRERLFAVADLTGPAALPPEGSVLPDTYDYRPGEPRAAVLARMQAAMTVALARAWRGRAHDTPVRTPAEAVTLASIIEKETGKTSERALVAGVYANRLRQGVKLDADPTVIYPVTQGRPLGRRIRRSELDADTGYNTYVRPGLPKGPITNPGRASLLAALHPARTAALYFVADGTGGHVFAETLAEQNANVRKWFALRRARGER